MQALVYCYHSDDNVTHSEFHGFFNNEEEAVEYIKKELDNVDYDAKFEVAKYELEYHNVGDSKYLCPSRYVSCDGRFYLINPKSKTQSQAALYDQLIELIKIANKNGLYDAADLIRNVLEANLIEIQRPKKS